MRSNRFSEWFDDEPCPPSPFMLNLGMEVGDEYEEARQKQSALGVHNDCRGPIAPMPIIPNSYIEHRNNPRPTRSSYNPSQTIHDPIPDDGLRAWLVVFGGVINFIVAFGVMNSFGTFQAFYSDKFSDASTSTISWIGSTQTFLLFLGGIVAGPMFDKWGTRPLMITGTCLVCISFLSNSFCKTYWQYLASQGLVFGCGNSLLFYPTTSAISEWFEKKRAFALGIAVAGSSVGGILWPIIIDKLLNSVGESWTHRILGLIAAPILACSCVLVVERRPKGNQKPRTGSAALGRSILAELIDCRFIALSIANCLILGGMLIPFFYVPLFAESLGIDPTMANNSLAVGYAGSVVGRISAGWLGDHFGRFNVLFGIGCCMSLTTYLWSLASSLPSVMAFAFLFGLFSGGLIPLGSACVAQTTKNMEHLGLRMGSVMAVSAIGALAGGPLSGAIKDNGGGWLGVFALSGSVTLVGSIVLIVLRFSWMKDILVPF